MEPEGYKNRIWGNLYDTAGIDSILPITYTYRIYYFTPLIGSKLGWELSVNYICCMKTAKDALQVWAYSNVLLEPGTKPVMIERYPECDEADQYIGPVHIGLNGEDVIKENI